MKTTNRIAVFTRGGDSPGMNGAMSPASRDRVLASRPGSAAVQTILDGHSNVMVGVVNNRIQLTPLKNTWSKKKRINYDLPELAKVLN